MLKTKALDDLYLKDNQRKTLESTLDYLTDETLQNMKVIVQKEIDTLLKIVDFHETFRKAQKQIEKKKYEAAAESIGRLSSLFESLKIHNFVNVDKLGLIVLELDSQLSDLDSNYVSKVETETFTKKLVQSNNSIYENPYKIDEIEEENTSNITLAKKE